VDLKGPQKNDVPSWEPLKSIMMSSFFKMAAKLRIKTPHVKTKLGITANVLQTKVGTQCDKLATKLSWQRFRRSTFELYRVICQKLLILTYSTCIWHLHLEQPHLSFAKTFGIRKLESLGYHVALFAWPTFSPLSRTPTCDRQTDRQTHDHGIHHTSTALRCKNQCGQLSY